MRCRRISGGVSVLNLLRGNERDKASKITLPETNIVPEKGPSQQEIHLENHPFSGAMLVSGRVCATFHWKVFPVFPYEMKFVGSQECPRSG